MTRTTQIILAVLAGGLWVNAAATLLRSSPALAQVPTGLSISQIAQDITAIAAGTCTNHKLCGP